MENPAQLQKAIHKLIAAHARDLSGALHEHRVKLYPPEARKTLRSFSSTEAAKLIGVNDGYLRHLSIEGKGPQPEIGNNNRRSYSVETIQALREYLDLTGKTIGVIPQTFR